MKLPLEELHLDTLEQLDEASFRHLPALKRLQCLTVRFCRLGDEILRHIARCTELRELDLVYNRFSDQGVQELLNLKKLEKLDIDYMDKHRDLIEKILGKPLPKRRRR